jgi:hypothetical protein
VFLDGVGPGPDFVGRKREVEPARVDVPSEDGLDFRRRRFSDELGDGEDVVCRVAYGRCELDYLDSWLSGESYPPSSENRPSGFPLSWKVLPVANLMFSVLVSLQSTCFEYPWLVIARCSSNTL